MSEIEGGFATQHEAIVAAERDGWTVYRLDGGSGHYVAAINRRYVAAIHRWRGWDSGGWKIEMMQLEYLPGTRNWRWHVVVRCVPQRS